MKKQMKKLIYIIPAVLLLGSCNKFLAVEPKQNIDQSQAIVDAGSAGTAANGLFNLLGASGYYGENFPAISYLAGGDIQWTGSQADASSINAHLTSATNGYIESAWTAIYKTIAQANYILA